MPGARQVDFFSRLWEPRDALAVATAMPMSPPTSPHGRRPGAPHKFLSGDYEILDSRLADCGEVMLWSVAGRAPQRGELFTIERDRRMCDLSVVEVTGHNPGWSALCRRVEYWGHALR